MTPIVFYLFVAIIFNAADGYEGGGITGIKDLKTCQAMQATAEASFRKLNASESPAFKHRWTTACVPLVAADKGDPV